MTDLHIHTRFSFDSEEAPENYIEAAKARGESFLGFAEHFDYGDKYGGEHLDFESYGKKVRSLNDTIGSTVKILKGIELGYSQKAEKVYSKLLKDESFDYAILSVHSIDGRGDCYYPEFYSGLDKVQAYKLYLQAVQRSVNADIDIQVIGHIGYISRYAPYEDKKLFCPPLITIIEDILKTVIARGICLELNTATGGLCDFVPERQIAETYIALGGKDFTFGSDAHSVQRYMQNSDAVKAFLLSRGIDNIFRFENGKKIPEKL